MANPNGTDGNVANTHDCFRTFIGERLLGYFTKGGDSYLVFDDGRALVFHHETGAYWTLSASDVSRHLAIVASQLQRDTEALKNVLTLAGQAV